VPESPQKTPTGLNDVLYSPSRTQDFVSPMGNPSENFGVTFGVYFAVAITLLELFILAVGCINALLCLAK